MSKQESTIAAIRDTLTRSVADALDVAEVSLPFPAWSRRDIMSKPCNRGIIRAHIFESGRTAIVINYSDGIAPEVVRVTSAAALRAYLNGVGERAIASHEEFLARLGDEEASIRASGPRTA